MHQIYEAWWIAIVDEGDTPASVAAWIEKNILPVDEFGLPMSEPYEEGDVDYSAWMVEVHAGDVLVFVAPPPHMTVRYPGWASQPEAPMGQEDREKLEHGVTNTWNRKGNPVGRWIVDMSTKLREIFQEEI